MATGHWLAVAVIALPVKGGVDTRTYKVSFAAIKTAMPGFACQWTVERGVQEMAARFRIFRPVIVPELVTLEPVSPGELGGAIVHATRVGGLRLALDRPALTVEAER